MNRIYYGEGWYDYVSKLARYKVYLPTIAGVTYKFNARPVYNFSKTSNKILIFMEMEGKDDEDLSEYTTGSYISLPEFSVDNTRLQKIDPTCSLLNHGSNINIEVIIMHDNLYDESFAKLNFFNKSMDTNKNIDGMDIPKKAGLGTLRPTRF